MKQAQDSCTGWLQPHAHVQQAMAAHHVISGARHHKSSDHAMNCLLCVSALLTLCLALLSWMKLPFLALALQPCTLWDVEEWLHRCWTFLIAKGCESSFQAA